MITTAYAMGTGTPFGEPVPPVKQALVFCGLILFGVLILIIIRKILIIIGKAFGKKKGYTKPMDTQGMTRRDPGLAAVISLFIWGGGQIYNGEIWKGLGLIIVEGIFLLTAVIISPDHGTAFFAAIIGVIGIIDAYKSAVKINMSLELVEDYALKKCPYCAERIKVEAIVCRYCGRDIKSEA